MRRIPRLPDTFRWRLAIGAVLIAGSYLAWLIIPLVVSSGLSPKVKTALTAVLGATPPATKFTAVALLGRPTINYLKNHPLKLSVKQQDSRYRTGDARASLRDLA